MSENVKVPEGYHSIQPYMMFAECDRAIAFYKQAFNAAEKMCMRRPDGRVMHAEIRIGDSVIMMADENAAMGAFATAHYGGSPVSIMLYTDACDATYKSALEAGGKSLRPPADQDYGDRMAGVVDPFGYHWWIATPIAKQSAVEAGMAV